MCCRDMVLLPHWWVAPTINRTIQIQPLNHASIQKPSLIPGISLSVLSAYNLTQLSYSSEWFSIMAIPLASVAALSTIAGVISHLSYFIHGEHMLNAYKLVIIALFGPPTIVALLNTLAGLPLSYAVQLTAVSYGAYMAALFTSILVYRAFFHPLRHFAGPRLARLSQLYHVFRISAKVDNYRHLDRLHKQYGEYVRVGPNLLSISDPDVIELIFHPQSQFTKAEC